MSDSDIQFLKNLKLTLWSVTGVLVSAIMLAGVAFYFNAQNDIKQNSIDIEELKKDNVLLKAEYVPEKVFKLTLENIEFQLKELNKKIDKDVRY